MHLLLIDDHPLFRAGFAHALKMTRPGLQIDVASTLQEGLTRAALSASLDIALIDYRLGASDGIAGLRTFAVQYPLVARVLISGDESDAIATAARAAGASGFLGKSLSVEVLLARLDQVLDGGTAFGAPLHTPTTVLPQPSPTARQMEVLVLLAQGLPNKRIAAELGIAERTVKLHVSALLQLLGAQNRTHLLVQARHCGLL